MMNRNVKIAKELVKIAKGLTAETDGSGSVTPVFFVMKCYCRECVEETYKDGEIDDCGSDYHWNITVKDADLRKCVEKAFKELNMDYDKNAICVAGNEILISVKEDKNGLVADQSDLDAWRDGRRRLWNCIYRWKVTMRTEQDADEDYMIKELGIY